MTECILVHKAPRADIFGPCCIPSTVLTLSGLPYKCLLNGWASDPEASSVFTPHLALGVRLCPAAVPIANNPDGHDFWYTLLWRVRLGPWFGSRLGRVLGRKMPALCSQESWWKISNSPAVFLWKKKLNEVQLLQIRRLGLLIYCFGFEFYAPNLELKVKNCDPLLAMDIFLTLWSKEPRPYFCK